MLGGVAVAAGASGLVLLSIPGSTPRFFSWGLSPPAVAAVVGGFYLASSAVFALAMALPPAGFRTLAVASLFLTVPTFVATLVHLDLFDFGRWQAMAWLLLFAGAPVVFAVLLILTRGQADEPNDPPPPWARVVMAALATGFAASAVALWWRPGSAGRWLPLESAGLGGRFLGSWMAFLAAMAVAALVAGREGSRIALAALVAFPAGALVGTLRLYGQLEPDGRLPFVLAVAGLIVVTTATAVRMLRTQTSAG